VLSEAAPPPRLTDSPVRLQALGIFRSLPTGIRTAWGCAGTRPCAYVQACTTHAHNACEMCRLHMHTYVRRPHMQAHTLTCTRQLHACSHADAIRRTLALASCTTPSAISTSTWQA
jgi:hypothetical protein